MWIENIINNKMSLYFKTCIKSIVCHLFIFDKFLTVNSMNAKLKYLNMFKALCA